MQEVQYLALRAKSRVRRIFREMLLCAAVAFLFLAAITRNFEILPALLLTLLICPVLWVAYRFVRFVVGY